MTEKEFDIVTLGELLIDFTESGLSKDGGHLFEQNAGGAVANVACAAKKLLLNTAFIGKVGDDMHGRFLKATLDDVGVNTSGLVISKDVFTTLAFVSLSENGEREFSFARKPGADTALKTSEVDESLLKSCRIFHFGSLSLTDEPSRSATVFAAKRAKAAGAVISFDPNFRAPLWKSEDEAKKRIKSVLPLVDIIKISDEETKLVTGFAEPEKAFDELLRIGCKCAVVTLGKDGAVAATSSAGAKSEAKAKRAVDTTGAGDAFWGGFLYKLIRNEKPIEAYSKDELFGALKFANAVAGFCVGRRGAIPSLPTIDELE